MAESTSTSNSSSSGTDWTGAVLAGLSSMFQSSQASSDAKAKNKDEYTWSSRLMKYKAALDDYYKLRDRQEYRNAAGEYGKFSSLDQWAPGYTQTYRPLNSPAAPPGPNDTMGEGGGSYYNQYTGGNNPGIPGGTSPGSSSSTDPLGLLNDGIKGNYEEWRRGGG